MRKLTWMTALALALVAGTHAPAQRAVTFGNTPKQTVNVPIDTSMAVAPFPEPQLTKPKGFSFSDLVPDFVGNMFKSKPAVRTQLPTSSPSGVRALQSR